MTMELPKIKYKGKTCVVDFRLEELRCGKKPVTFMKFTNLPEGKHSPVKKKLRALRFRTYGGGYIRGVDD